MRASLLVCVSINIKEVPKRIKQKKYPKFLQALYTPWRDGINPPFALRIYFAIGPSSSTRSQWGDSKSTRGMFYSDVDTGGRFFGVIYEAQHIDTEVHNVHRPKKLPRKDPRAHAAEISGPTSPGVERHDAPFGSSRVLFYKIG